MEYKLMGADTLQDKVFKDKVAEDKVFKDKVVKDKVVKDKVAEVKAVRDKTVNNMVLQAKLIKGRVFENKVVKDKLDKDVMEQLAVSIVEEEDIQWAKLVETAERKYYHHQSCLWFAIFSIAWQIFEVLLKISSLAINLPGGCILSFPGKVFLTLDET